MERPSFLPGAWVLVVSQQKPDHAGWWAWQQGPLWVQWHTTRGWVISWVRGGLTGGFHTNYHPTAEEAWAEWIVWKLEEGL